VPTKKPSKKPAAAGKVKPAKPAKPSKAAPAKPGMKPLSGGMKPINSAKPVAAVVPASPPPPTKKHPNRVPPPPIGKNAPRPMPKKEPVEEKGKKTPKIDYATALSVAAVAVQQKADNAGYVMVNGRRVRMLSSKGAAPVKKVSKAAAAAAKARVEEPIDVSAIRTKLSAKELEGYREVLLRSRYELVGRVDSLEDEALRSSGGNLSNMPLHMADVGTDTFDQEFALNMAASDREKLAEIDAALQRIADRTYGVCQITGKPIPKARLDANPLAKYTVEAARLVERGVAR
jgi:RNA polymerase-binding transcription factor DksA